MPAAAGGGYLADGFNNLFTADDLAEHGAVAGEEVDEALGEASLAEYLVDQVVGEDRRVARLPQGRVTLIVATC